MTKSAPPSPPPGARRAADDASAARDARDAPPHADGATRISALEWLVAGVGLLLVVATVAFMIVDAARTDGAPPSVVVRADSVIALGDAGWLVQFTAENRGRATAADVGIVGELGDAGEVETSRTTVDYVPGRSARRGGLLFRADPRRATLRLRAEGYQEP